MTDVAKWREQLGRLGVWTPTDGMSSVDAVQLACLIEDLGYRALWLPETMGRDPFVHIAHLADSTSRLIFATGIANIHHRHPGPMRQATETLAEQTGGRFLLGLGVSHAPMVEGIRGLEYGKPVSTMRKYLEAMDASPYMAPSPPNLAPRLIGALGPRMIELSGELADGIHPYWTTPEHTATARQILGPDKLLCVEQKVVLTPDPVVARNTARQALGVYIGLPNYRNNWLRLGFSEEAITDMDDEFLDALVAWGDADSIRMRVAEHHQAGADHVCIQVMAPNHAFRVDQDALHELAPT
jgi:probable F420-dependent oxidoreductase